MKGYLVLVGICLTALMGLTGCSSAPSGAKAEATPTSPASQPISESVPTTGDSGTASPAATGSAGSVNPAPEYEVIARTMQNIEGHARPVPKPQLKALDDYTSSLAGKNVDWSGWVVTVNPDKKFLEEDNELDTYSGYFRVYVTIDDNPNVEEDMHTGGLVIIQGATRQQVEQLALWQDRTKAPPYEKIHFTASISGVLSDPILIFLVASTIELVK